MTPRMTLSVNNPDILKKEDLIRGFVARQPLLDRLMDDLRREGSGREGSKSAPQHQLIVGQRGFGKTTLLHHLAFAVEDDPHLKATRCHWYCPEEQYNVATLADFWLNCADTLSDALDRAGEESASQTLDAAIASVQGRGESARPQRCKSWWTPPSVPDAEAVLLVDNIDIIFDRIGEAKEWDFRRALSSERRLHIVGASSRTIEATYNHGRAFYDFFQIHHLKGLDDDEALAVLSQLAKLSGDEKASQTIKNRRGRIKTIRLLTGGNPRTLVLLYRILAEESEGDVQHDIEQLLDHYTAAVQGALRGACRPGANPGGCDGDSLGPIDRGRPPLSSSESTSLTVNQVSAQLNRLEDLGVVEKAAWYGEDKEEDGVSDRRAFLQYLVPDARQPSNAAKAGLAGEVSGVVVRC